MKTGGEVVQWLKANGIGLVHHHDLEFLALLERHGLHLIDAKAKAVLDGAALMSSEGLRATADLVGNVPGVSDDISRAADFCRAELARRSPPTEPGAE